MAGPVRVHLVRHAQGLHNVSATNYTLVDPPLTAYGKRECAKLAARFPGNVRIGMLAASPLRRTLETARLSFPAHVAAGKRIVALADAQEVGDWPCDHGSPRTKMATEYAAVADFDLVPNGWELKAGASRYRRDYHAIKARAQDLRCWLRDRAVELGEKGEGDIVLVSHGGFLHFLTDDWSDFDRNSGTGWTNTQFRSYTFSDVEQATLEETQESKNLRTKTPKPNRTEFIKMQKKKLQQKTVKGTVSALFKPQTEAMLHSIGTDGMPAKI